MWAYDKEGLTASLQTTLIIISMLVNYFVKLSNNQKSESESESCTLYNNIVHLKLYSWWFQKDMHTVQKRTWEENDNKL